jgi:deoxyribodipyrimidine photolyase-related protein
VPIRRLFVVLGDQLDRAALRELDPRRDSVWMAEVEAEATHVWCHKQRLLLFFSAMRHFRDALRAEDISVHYRVLSKKRKADEPKNHGEALLFDLERLSPEQVVLTQPGDIRVLRLVREAAEQAGVPLEVQEDPHFYLPLEAFKRWADGRKTLLLEHFYRMMRKREGILLDPGGEPTGGAWNFDADNRAAFGKAGPPPIPAPPGHPGDATTDEAREMIEARYPHHPGSMDAFDLPVTAEEARALVDHFIEHRLPFFGKYQDAMWDADPVLWHSRLSAPLNLKLVSPRDLVTRAVDAHARGHAPIQSVEGFVRQILGWREFIRGVYWTHMPEYAERNALGCEDRPVPRFFWDGETDMACVAGSVRALLERGYVHHIHRLMVLGLFSMQLGVHPYRFHEWHMAMYLDAVDWVSLPNALGMSQYGDGGIVGTKPYAATGKYIQRMSNFCGQCKYRPTKAEGDDACPFTTLYWDFLDRHRGRLEGNRRMALQVKNLDRKSEATLDAIRTRARWLRAQIDADERI